MTGGTVDNQSVFEGCVVNGAHHQDVLAGNLFCGLVVFGELILNMTASTGDAQRAGHKIHGSQQLRRGHAFENLNVLVRPLGRPLLLNNTSLFGGKDELSNGASSDVSALSTAELTKPASAIKAAIRKPIRSLR